MTNTIKKIFEDNLVLARAIEFQDEWNNGTGYFDKAAEVEVQAGDMLQATCPETNRRLLFVGTELGTVVVFERYNPLESEPFVLVTNGVRAALAGSTTTGPLDEFMLESVIAGTYHYDFAKEETTMSDKTETTNEKKTTGKIKGYARKAGKGLLYGAGAVAVAGGAYALYAVLKGAGAGEAAEAVGEAAGAAVSAAGEAVAETVAAWK